MQRDDHAQPVGLIDGPPCGDCPAPDAECVGRRAPNVCRLARSDARWRSHLATLATGTEPAATPYASPDDFLAPLRPAPGCPPIPHSERPWEGVQACKPWEYRITAAIVHLDTPGLLRAVLTQLRAQTERPYLIVVDAGSLTVHRAELERMELDSDNMEVHYLRPRAWRYTSQPVAVAMDLAFSVCQSEFCYATHTDVFLKRPDYLEWLVARCDAKTPAVGYQMSPRSWDTDLWKRILSHTASLYHMPTMRRIGATWNLLGAIDRLGLRHEQCWNGWPDTEVGLGLALHAAGIGERWIGDPDPGPGDPPSVLMIGPEPNHPYETEWLWHERSFTGHRLYASDSADERRPRVEARAAEAVRLAETWRRRASKLRVPLGQPTPDR